MGMRFGVVALVVILIVLVALTIRPSAECDQDRHCYSGYCDGDGYCTCRTSSEYYRCDSSARMPRPYYGYYRGYGNDASPFVGSLVVWILLFVGIGSCIQVGDKGDKEYAPREDAPNDCGKDLTRATVQRRTAAATLAASLTSRRRGEVILTPLLVGPD